MNIHKSIDSPGKAYQNAKQAWFSQPGGGVPADGGKWGLCVGEGWGLCTNAGICVTRAGTRRRTRVGARLWRRDSEIAPKPNTRLTICAHRTLIANMLQFAMPNIAGGNEKSKRKKGNAERSECGESAMRFCSSSDCSRKHNNHPPHPSPIPIS